MDEMEDILADRRSSDNTQKLTTDPSPSAKTSTKPSMITGSKVLCEEWSCEMTKSGAAKVLCEGEEWSCETGGNRGFAKGQRKNDDRDLGVNEDLCGSAEHPLRNHSISAKLCPLITIMSFRRL